MKSASERFMAQWACSSSQGGYHAPGENMSLTAAFAGAARGRTKFAANPRPDAANTGLPIRRHHLRPARPYRFPLWEAACPPLRQMAGCCVDALSLRHFRNLAALRGWTSALLRDILVSRSRLTRPFHAISFPLTSTCRVVTMNSNSTPGLLKFTRYLPECSRINLVRPAEMGSPDGR
jgi:hypothetical protein